MSHDDNTVVWRFAKLRLWQNHKELLIWCKMVNLVNTLSWLRGMLSVNGRSHVIRHVLTLRIFGASKKLRFWQNREEVFNRLNSTNWIELHKGNVQGPRGEVTCRGKVTCRGHASCPGGVVTMQTLWVKHRCQLVVRLKTNKYYQELLCLLSSYINFLNLINL